MTTNQKVWNLETNVHVDCEELAHLIDCHATYWSRESDGDGGYTYIYRLDKTKKLKVFTWEDVSRDADDRDEQIVKNAIMFWYSPSTTEKRNHPMQTSTSFAWRRTK